MNTESPELFNRPQSVALELIKSNLDAATALTKGPLTEVAIDRVVDVSLSGLRIARPPRTSAHGIGLDQGLDPAYVIRKGREIIESVYETIGPVDSSFIGNVERQTTARGLRWRIEGGAALVYPTRSVAVIVWDRGRPSHMLTHAEEQELRRPVELLVDRTMRGDA